MRKIHITTLCFVFLLLVTASVLATPENEPQNIEQEESNQDSPELPEANGGENVQEIATQAGGAAIDATKQGLFGIGANDSAITKIELPSELDIYFTTLFQIKESPVTIDLAIILLCWFMMCYILVYQLVATSGKKPIAVLAGLGTAILGSLLGYFYWVIVFIRELFDESFVPSVKIIFFIIIVGLAILLVSRFIMSMVRSFKNADRVEAAGESGQRLGNISGYLQKYLKRK